MAEAQFREYHESIRPPAAPRANFDDFHLVASTVRLWFHKTRHGLGDVLTPGYFENVADLRFRLDDRIEIVAGNWPAQHGLCVVDHVSKNGGDVQVTLLSLYVRAT
jgi:hypothetical protein